MTAHNKTLTLIASKLGLSEEEKVLNKAAEFLRLLQMKNVAGSNMTDTSKVVICLDLAAGLFGAEFDVKTAVKFSGLKPTMYTNSRKVVENLLELKSDKITTSTLCLTLQCASVQELADQILLEYQKQAKMELDLDLPQYVCMAVYQASRVSKVKVGKSKLIEKSRLRPAQWSKLDADWSKFVDEKFTVAKKKRGRPPKNAVADENDHQPMEVEDTKEEIQEPQIESYEDWKRRMLEAAYKELAALENVAKLTSEQKYDVIPPTTPRRSPRKTPQKYSPYKSPSKKNGVRLLFPLNL